MPIRGIYDSLGMGNVGSEHTALYLGGALQKIDNTRGKLHHRLMVLDAEGADQRVVTGSLNWTEAGDRRNSENTAFAALWAGAPWLSCGQRQWTESVYLPLRLGMGSKSQQ
jgi:hypothetical protein